MVTFYFETTQKYRNFEENKSWKALSSLNLEDKNNTKEYRSICQQNVF